MERKKLRAIFILGLVYLSAFFIFQMSAQAHDVQCPPCNCDSAHQPPGANSLTAAATSGPATAVSAGPATNAATAKPAANKPFKKIFAEFSTSMGNFRVLLYHGLAPRTVENFVGLAEGTKEYRDRATNELLKRPFFNGLKFHRVRKDFFVQSGDPSGDGTGGPGYTLNSEFSPQLTHSKPGILAMASSAQGQNGSQFFISLTPRPDLDKKNTVFGEVVSGLEVVQAISRVPINRGIERPLKDVLIQAVTIVRE